MTDDDLAFLDAICDRPFDAYPKRVYADWLGNHHRPAEEAFWRWAADAGREPEDLGKDDIPSSNIRKSFDWNSPTMSWVQMYPEATKGTVVSGELVKTMNKSEGIFLSYYRGRSKEKAWTALRDAWVEVEWPKLLQNAEV
jgi:uncharacterized protein (TIGR02996 family)